METVIIVIHLMVIVALIAVVLLQRSEGGALGIGGGGNFMTTRGQGNVLTRADRDPRGGLLRDLDHPHGAARFADRPASILDNVPARQHHGAGAGRRHAPDGIGARPARTRSAPAPPARRRAPAATEPGAPTSAASSDGSSGQPPMPSPAPARSQPPAGTAAVFGCRSDFDSPNQPGTG